MTGVTGVTGVDTEAESRAKLLFSYGLPHGYLRLDLNPPVEKVIELVEQVLSLPAELRERAESVTRFYAGVAGLLNAQDVLGCALGPHPDGAGGFTSSVLMVCAVPASGADARLVLASLAGTASDRPDEGMRPLDSTRLDSTCRAGRDSSSRVRTRVASPYCNW
ncbi:hypothetical protein [Streptomyces ziwulingensis]|uniref:Uncharacterized protein n=1 Tax=Streptomyces ziwulingensis TaxID=1045501 RepID=A0ABP9CBJ4_9ACTN